MMPFKAGSAGVAGPPKENISINFDFPSTSLTHTPRLLNSSSIYPFITETYRDLKSYISDLHNDFQLMQTINKYKKGCNEIYTKALESYNRCHQLVQNIVRTMDIFKELSTRLPDLEEYNYRLCEIMSIFIMCELRLSADAVQHERILIAQRIIYIMRRHLVQEDEQATSYNMLRTLVYIPKLFNARDIMCAIFGEFIPLKPVPEVNVLPDKLYMLYIIVFYRWMMMQKDDDDKLLIVNFAESFMKPSVSLCSNNLYGAYLPMYTKHSTATRTILNNLKYYGDIRNACIIDNALRQAGTVVNLCDDEEDDLIFVDTSPTTDFAQIFASVRLEPLNGGIANIKLEEKTVVGTVDLTDEEEPLSQKTSINMRHDKWLNDFQKLANQYRESQLLLEKQQNKHVSSNGEKDAIICLDSDSEEESEDISAALGKETSGEAVNNLNNLEDLFADNYPLTNTPLNCDSDLESLDADDENDITKISPRFLSSNLRTYESKKSNDKNKSGANEQNKSQEIERVYRRDSIHISSTPPEEPQDEEDDGTDVQDENDLFEDEEEAEDADETQPYTFLPTTSRRSEKELFPQKIKPMGPYPTYNSMQADKVVFSQSVSRYSQHHHNQQKPDYYSDNSEMKTSKKQKKRVQFNTNPLGPTTSSEPQKLPLKPAIQQTKYKSSDAIDYYHLRGFERFSCAPNIEDSVSNSSSNKQQESTTDMFNNHPTINIKKVNHNNVCSKFCKNLSVFKQKSLSFHKKQKPIKNVKIKLKRLKLSKDISLTNLKSNLTSKVEPHTNTHNFSKDNLNDAKIETCQLNTCPTPTTANNNDDDIIFKKPLPVTKKPPQVTKKVLSTSRPFKIQKVVSLRRIPYSFKHRDPFKAENTKNFCDFQRSLPTNDFKLKEQNFSNEKHLRVNETKVNLKTSTKNNIFDAHVDDLSKISKLLTDEISNLTGESNKSGEKIETNNVQFSEGEKNEELKKPVIRDSIHESANEEKNRNNTNVKDDESQSGSVSPDTQEIARIGDPTLKKNDDLNLNIVDNEKSDNLNANLETASGKLKLSKLSDCEETVLYSKTEGSSSLSSAEEGEEIVNVFIKENEHLTGVAPSNQTEGNKNIPDEVRSTKDVEMSAQAFPLTTNNVKNSPSESNKTDENSIELIPNSNNLITNFSAEFLAGLPNEPSPSTIDAEENNCESNNEVDFEFENNCTTPTMCRIDLDVMSENTSDIPSQMSTSECEADKLLEDFNNKTEDIVGCTLNKKTANPDKLLSGVTKDTKTVRENKNKIATAIINQEVEPNNELVCEPNNGNADADTEQGRNTGSPTDVCVSEQSVVNNADKHDLSQQIAVQCDENSTHPVSNKKPKLFNDARELSKSQTNSDTSSKVENQQSNSNNFNKTTEIFKVNTEEIINAQTDESLRDTDDKDVLLHNSSKIDQATRNEVMSQEKATSINEDQRTTLNLGNCDQDKQNKGNNNDSEAGGVSAIFSFPKTPRIPIISISILTTPNNKTYFKISNRENDEQTKDGGMSKRVKTVSSEDKTKNIEESDDAATSVSIQKIDNQLKDEAQIKKLKSHQSNSDEEKAANTLDENEVKDIEVAMRHQAGKINEDYDEDIDKCDVDEDDEDEEDVDEGDIDNFEIEKYSHDSNSACSLPLKKRPTQADPNGDTSDSQTAMNLNYDQPQEIAAEVVIENTCKDKPLSCDNTLLQLQEESFETTKQEEGINKDAAQKINCENDTFDFLNEIDDNKPSTSSACFRNLIDPSSPFKRRGQAPIRPIGQTPIQIVAPQLKGSPVMPNQDHRIVDSQVCSASRMSTQFIQPLPESYPATPMLSVANVEKLMDFNRFIEDLLASPDVVTIIDNANACGYYAEGQAYELERIAILEHYNIANAKGSTTVTKPLYWKKSAGDTISIFNDNDNEWISLPPSTAKQLQKLSFVLSILQQQYKVTDVRQRINIALAFLIRNTSKFKNTSTSNVTQQRAPMYSRSISNHNNSSILASSTFFRNATNNESINSNFNMNSSIENTHNFHSANYSNNQSQPEMILQQESNGNSNQNWNNATHFPSSTTTQIAEQISSVNSPQRFNSSSIESEQQQLQQVSQTPDKRTGTSDELSTDQLYINPPCASSPQNEVIVNTNGVELLEIPQDPQNIFISITDESGATNAETSNHKYNTRQQVRVSDELEAIDPSCSSQSQQSYCKRSCLPNIPNHFMRHNIIPTFGNQEINLQNPYRVQQQQQQNINTNVKSNFQQRNMPQQNSSSNNNNRQPPLSSQHHQKSKQYIPSRFTSTFNTQLSINSPQNQSKSNDPNFKEILQPYITYLIKDHEKTSKHLLQVFEEVSNSNASNGPVIDNLNQHQQQFKSFLPPLIRNPQQNHMPGFHQMSDNCGSVLPSLIRNPHQTTLFTRDSGALQVVQSFIEQSQTAFDAAQQKTDRQLQLQLQQQPQSSATIPGFAKEYANFVGTREKQRNCNKIPHEGEQPQPHPPERQLNEQFVQLQQESQRLNSLKRKCQERNDKLAEDLKRKMVEFSLIKHDVQAKLFEKQQKQQSEINLMENNTMAKRQRGRPKRGLNKLQPQKTNETMLSAVSSGISSKDISPNKYAARTTRRKQTKNDLSPTSSGIDHAYFRQRTAAREAAKRINATANNNFH